MTGACPTPRGCRTPARPETSRMRRRLGSRRTCARWRAIVRTRSSCSSGKARVPGTPTTPLCARRTWATPMSIGTAGPRGLDHRLGRDEIATLPTGRDSRPFPLGCGLQRRWDLRQRIPQARRRRLRIAGSERPTASARRSAPQTRRRRSASRARRRRLAPEGRVSPPGRYARGERRFQRPVAGTEPREPAPRVRRTGRPIDVLLLLAQVGGAGASSIAWAIAVVAATKFFWPNCKSASSR